MSNNALWIILQKLRIPLLVIIVTYSIAMLGMVLIPGVDDKGEIYHLTFFDAFYFVSYMASTIGFGESPYAFTYQQKLWVSFCIYLTVVGWFYGLGALVSAFTDKTLQHELMRNRFKKSVKHIQNNFIIVLGYTYVNAEIIKKIHRADIELDVVLIDKDEERINHFLLEDFSRDIPVMVGDALLTQNLKDAGIQHKNCKSIVSLFEDEEKNLRISILTKFLNPQVKVIAQSTLTDISISILDTDIAKVINPFQIFAKRIDIALESPHILILENWIYAKKPLNHKAQFLPKGKYIVCGYGRFGKELQAKLEKHQLDYVFIDEKRLATQEMIENGKFFYANPDNKDVLLEVGIKNAVALIVGTQHDIDNLSIVITAKKLNPNLYIIARENAMQEISLFQAANIDWVFIIENIIINKTSLTLTEPLKHLFLKLILNKNEIWANSLVELLYSTIGNNPKLMVLSIHEKQSYAIYHALLKGEEIRSDIFLHSLKNREEKNKIIPLLIYRKEETILLPKNQILKIDDKILFACDSYAKEDIELIAANIYELDYAQYGEEKQYGLFKKICSKF